MHPRYREWLARSARTLREATIVAAVAAMVLAAPATAQVTLTKIVDASTPRPDGAGNFFVPAPWEPPAVDGSIVVFRAFEGTSFESLWTFNLVNGSLKKLVDRTTAAPGGVGTFVALQINGAADAPLLSNGTVVFGASDSSGGAFKGGIFTVPVAGGAPSRVVNYGTVMPGSGDTFTALGMGAISWGGFSIHNGVVAFQGSGATFSGVYRANADGTALTAAADGLRPIHPEFTFPINVFGSSGPVVNNGRVAFSASSVFDPVSGFHGLYTAPCNAAFANCVQTTAPTSVSEAANSGTALPGDTSAAKHTRFTFPHVALEGDHLYFRADNSFSGNPGYNGIFVRKGTAPLRKIIANTDALPGLASVNANSFSGFSVSNGHVLFTAFDADAQNKAVYLKSGNTITRLLGTGDRLPDGRVVWDLAQTGRQQLTCGAAVLNVNSFFFGTLWAVRIGGSYGGNDTDGDGVPDLIEFNECTNPDEKDNDVFVNNRLFVMQLYRDLLRREATTAEIASSTGALNGGQSKAALVEQMVRSVEYQDLVGPITRLYTAYFLRPPELGGLNFWVDAYKVHNPWSFIGISNFFVISDEFRLRYGSLNNEQFVTLIYQNILGRAPDPGGFAFWTSELSSGRRNPGQVMADFSESPENKLVSQPLVQVVALYLDLLKREVDPAVLAAWTPAIRAGGSIQPLISQILAAPEYRARFLP